MDLDELRTVRRTEREKDSLQHLRDSFYEDVAAYLSDLEARRDQAAAEADDPFASKDVRQLTDKIETAEEVSEAIYERRVGKIVKQASFAAAGMAADRDGLTEQEADLYDAIVSRIKQNKSSVLDVLAGEDDTASAGPASNGAAGDEAVGASASSDAASGGAEDQRTTDPLPADPTNGGESAETTVADESTATSESDGMLADAMGGETSAEQNPGEQSSVERGGAAESATEHVESDADDAVSTQRAEVPPEANPPDQPVPGSEPADADPTDDEQPTTGESDHTPTTDGGAAEQQRTTVRITRDVGEIFGVDEREYTLEREDVVTLPTTNAEPLVERDAAERLE